MACCFWLKGNCNFGTECRRPHDKSLYGCHYGKECVYHGMYSSGLSDEDDASDDGKDGYRPPLSQVDRPDSPDLLDDDGLLAGNGGSILGLSHRSGRSDSIDFHGERSASRSRRRPLPGSGGSDGDDGVNSKADPTPFEAQTSAAAPTLKPASKLYKSKAEREATAAYAEAQARLKKDNDWTVPLAVNDVYPKHMPRPQPPRRKSTTASSAAALEQWEASAVHTSAAAAAASSASSRFGRDMSPGSLDDLDTSSITPSPTLTASSSNGHASCHVSSSPHNLPATPSSNSSSVPTPTQLATQPISPITAYQPVSTTATYATSPPALVQANGHGQAQPTATSTAQYITTNGVTYQPVQVLYTTNSAAAGGYAYDAATGTATQYVEVPVHQVQAPSATNPAGAAGVAASASATVVHHPQHTTHQEYYYDASSNSYLPIVPLAQNLTTGILTIDANGQLTTTAATGFAMAPAAAAANAYPQFQPIIAATQPQANAASQYMPVTMVQQAAASQPARQSAAASHTLKAPASTATATAAVRAGGANTSAAAAAAATLPPPTSSFAAPIAAGLDGLSYTERLLVLEHRIKALMAEKQQTQKLADQEQELATGFRMAMAAPAPKLGVTGVRATPDTPSATAAVAAYRANSRCGRSEYVGPDRGEYDRSLSAPYPQQTIGSAQNAAYQKQHLAYQQMVATQRAQLLIQEKMAAQHGVASSRILSDFPPLPAPSAPVGARTFSEVAAGAPGPRRIGPSLRSKTPTAGSHAPPPTRSKSMGRERLAASRYVPPRHAAAEPPEPPAPPPRGRPTPTPNVLSNYVNASSRSRSRGRRRPRSRAPPPAPNGPRRSERRNNNGSAHRQRSKSRARSQSRGGEASDEFKSLFPSMAARMAASNACGAPEISPFDCLHPKGGQPCQCVDKPLLVCARCDTSIDCRGCENMWCKKCAPTAKVVKCGGCKKGQCRICAEKEQAKNEKLAQQNAAAQAAANGGVSKGPPPTIEPDMKWCHGCKQHYCTKCAHFPKCDGEGCDKKSCDPIALADGRGGAMFMTCEPHWIQCSICNWERYCALCWAAESVQCKKCLKSFCKSCYEERHEHDEDAEMAANDNAPPLPPAINKAAPAAAASK